MSQWLVVCFFLLRAYQVCRDAKDCVANQETL